MKLFSRPKIPTSTILEIDGQPVVVQVRTNARARNYRLSIPHSGGPVLTLPPHGRWADAEAFLRRQTNWLAARLPRAAAPVSFLPGAIIPLRGRDHLIAASGKTRGRVELLEEGDALTLMVPGDPAHQARRLTDWLKQEAEIDLKRQTMVHAANLGVTVRALRLRSQSTRWGSCSSAGNLNFNWRLILAPDYVLDYVAAHEVAHLVEMNHSAAFWATVSKTLPDMERGRTWLKANGRQLMAYGI
ncbi:SprT family zinc-dependent metalloprotease [Devosia rhodophyticola]|uniref:SprT family zinc-dependent metalloprotease n=1 Tax=Devosia rhodophyticola TaxID=3026423 RepID=A0ABY7Z0R5_9HYPH|nr:SprT family zinc-dependent metalloprotease [Devosia rhodophyticola]WDR07196.1 SprT family zinc-dependent metalloprotease [Devosia rhodophyticola]